MGSYWCLQLESIIMLIILAFLPVTYEFPLRRWWLLSVYIESGIRIVNQYSFQFVSHSRCPAPPQRTGLQFWWSTSFEILGLFLFCSFRDDPVVMKLLISGLTQYPHLLSTSELPIPCSKCFQYERPNMVSLFMSGPWMVCEPTPLFKSFLLKPIWVVFLFSYGQKNTK